MQLTHLLAINLTFAFLKLSQRSLMAGSGRQMPCLLQLGPQAKVVVVVVVAA